jgi:hypothetical protein
LFPETNLGRKESRGIVARYITLNICAELAERVFSRTLGHEHMARCVMEDSWSGLDAERASYSEACICQECHELAENYGTANRYGDKSVEQLISAINKMCQCAETIYKDSRKSYRNIIEVFLVVLGAGLATNLVAGYDAQTQTDVTTYINNHYYQVIGAVVFCLVGVVFGIRSILKNMFLP